MPDDTPWRWLRQHGLAVFLAVVAIVLFLLFSGYLTGWSKADRSANLLIKRHGPDAPMQAAMRADAMLDRWDVEGVYEGPLFRDSHPSSRIGTRKHEQPEGGKIMARKAKPKKKTKAPRKAAVTPIEAGLTKGELRKLNALKRSVGDQIGEKAFVQWLRNKTKSGTAVPRDRNAEMIADTLGKLVQDSGLKLPRGGYLVTRGHGRVVVTRAKSWETQQADPIQTGLGWFKRKADRATTRADAMLEKGDLDGYAVWKRILRAVGALLSKERSDGATVQ